MNVFGHVGLTLAVAYSVDRVLRERRARRETVRDAGVLPATGTLTSRQPHAGATPRSLDYRLVIIGSLLPDIIDKPLGLWVAPDLVNHSLRSIGHSVIFLVIPLVIALIALGTARWQSLLLLVAPSAGHLVLDQLWRDPERLLWPLLGWAWQAGPAGLSAWSSAYLQDTMVFYRDPAEVIGAAVLLVFAVKISRPRAFDRFARSGSVP